MLDTNFTIRNIDDVLPIKNRNFKNCLGRSTVQFEIKDTPENSISASSLDLLLSIGRDGQLYASLYDNDADFNFHTAPYSPAYGVFLSQLIRYPKAFSLHECFILRVTHLYNKLHKHAYECLKSSLRKLGFFFLVRFGDFIKKYCLPLLNVKW